jgi:aminoglycoside phosphotransferase (APT) family kinase protein
LSLLVQRDIDELKAGLSRWRGKPVATIERPAPGWSCETLVVDGDLVVRLPPLGDGAFPEYNLAQQAAVQNAVGASGTPVAPAHYEPDASYLGTPFIAMPFVAGPIPDDFTAGDPWLASLADDDARRSVWRSFLDTLVGIGATGADGLDLRTGLTADLVWWESYLAWATDGAPPRALAESLDWCREHRPTLEPPPSLLWGDVRLGNVVFDPQRLTPRAVLDWDMTSAGPTEMDLAWFLALEAVQRDLTGRVVPGFGTRAEAIRTVEAGIGRDLVNLDWYEIFALVRASAVSTRIAVLFERQGRPSMFSVAEDPTLAAATRRIAAR